MGSEAQSASLDSEPRRTLYRTEWIGDDLTFFDPGASLILKQTESWGNAGDGGTAMNG